MRVLRDLLWVCVAVTIISAVTQFVLAPADFSVLDWAVYGSSTAIFLALAAPTINRLSHRRPTPRWAWYVPVLIVVFFFSTTTLFGWDSVEYVFADNPDPAGPEPVGASITSMAVFASWLVLPIGWLATRRETAMWISSEPPSHDGARRGGGALRQAMRSAGTTIRVATHDAVGSAFRDQLRLKRNAGTPASASSGWTA